MFYWMSQGLIDHKSILFTWIFIFYWMSQGLIDHKSILFTWFFSYSIKCPGSLKVWKKGKTLSTRPIMNSEHLAQQGANRTWNSFCFRFSKSRTWNSLCSQNPEPGSHAGSTCAPQTQRRRRPRRVESTGHRRSTWCQWSCRQFEKSQTKHLAWKRSPFELIVFPFSSRACLQWLQLRGGFRGGFAGAPGRVGELGAETPSTWGRWEFSWFCWSSTSPPCSLGRTWPPYRSEAKMAAPMRLNA